MNSEKLIVLNYKLRKIESKICKEKNKIAKEKNQCDEAARMIQINHKPEDQADKL